MFYPINTHDTDSDHMNCSTEKSSFVCFVRNTNAEVFTLDVNVTFTVFALPFGPGIACKVLSVTEASQCVFLTCLQYAIMKRAHLWKLDPAKEGRGVGVVMGEREKRSVCVSLCPC